MKKEFEIYQDKKGNVYTLTTELEQLLLEDLVEIYSIIEEVREYIEIIVKNTPSSMRKDYANMLLIDYKKLLEILDKGSD